MWLGEKKGGDDHHTLERHGDKMQVMPSVQREPSGKHLTRDDMSREGAGGSPIHRSSETATWSQIAQRTKHVCLGETGLSQWRHTHTHTQQTALAALRLATATRGALGAAIASRFRSCSRCCCVGRWPWRWQGDAQAKARRWQHRTVLRRVAWAAACLG